ncbi:hypothetical protein K2173_001648 [Erythroxylum novogranatense]|uniref:GDSL esterase/lipase n=1 Tax=Erythroxylum novogranatense TaxID=1862640 RepID=A0AAV8T5P4_9ROSI|nr:hypothetical protein K2173_001648 [Erythroxylum novogranatense]
MFYPKKPIRTSEREIRAVMGSVLHFHLVPLIYLFLFHGNAQALSSQWARNNSATAVIVFGDSTVDPGNNNFVPTIFRGNFPPYGKDLVDHVATGRFSNGRLTTDFIASYVGLKDYVPPYLDPRLSMEELMTGVSFASAGSGFDPLTPKISILILFNGFCFHQWRQNVIPISKQLEYFREYKKKLQTVLGKRGTEDHINRAIFIISAGTNDFVVNYFTLPIRRKTYSVSAYQQFILQKATQVLQDLLDEGARRIIFNSLPPMGCLPVVITLYSNNHNAIYGRNCLDYYSSVAREFNLMLQKDVAQLQNRLANRGSRIYINDAYGALTNMIQGQGSSAFEVVNIGCCGTGYLEAGLLCNPHSYVCPDASKFVFWDSIHPTEKTYYNVFKLLRPVIDSLVRK